MRRTGIDGRIGRLERELGHPDEDERRLVESLRAIAEGREAPHKMTSGMRQRLAKALQELDAEADSLFVTVGRIE